MIIAGCDPGAKGAIAFIDAEQRRLLAIVDMPMAGPDLLVRELVQDIDGTLDGRRVGHLFIERQAPFAGGKRRVGASSAFHIGQRYMAPMAIAACLGWPLKIVSPVKWQKHFSIGKADKAKSLALAEQLMPLDCGLWHVRRGYCTKEQASGRCEAALIALYGVETLAGIGNQAAERAATLLGDVNELASKADRSR